MIWGYLPYLCISPLVTLMYPCIYPLFTPMYPVSLYMCYLPLDIPIYPLFTPGYPYMSFIYP